MLTYIFTDYMIKNQIQLSGGSLSYYKKGDSEKVILLFHGFGQSALSFENLISILSTEYTVYSFDLFFHGDSTLNSKNIITNEYWRNAIIKFTQVENISNFELLGFSMGAKFALLTYESFPTRVKQLYLIAPDGLYSSFWYNLATRNIIGRKLFKYIVSKPEFFFSLLNFMDKFNLIDKATLKFANLQMDNLEKRLLLYRVWTNFSAIELPINDITLQLRKHYTPITIIIGKNDNVIKFKNIRSFISKVPHVDIQEFNCGHTSLFYKMVDFFQKKYQLN